jgi:hypothetical protein
MNGCRAAAARWRRYASATGERRRSERSQQGKTGANVLARGVQGLAA